MRSRFSILLTIGIIALVATVGIFNLYSLQPTLVKAAPNTQEANATRVITVIGTGEVQAPPDTAIVDLGVQTEAETASAALRDNNARMAALLAKLQELGIAGEDIQTSHISIWQRYDEQGRTVVGYQANNMIRVTVHDINQAGALLEQVLDAGATTVAGIGFFVAEPAALQQAAREQAIADARSRATAMAQASGASLGQLLEITENIGAPPWEFFGDAAAGGGGAPIHPGQQTIGARVQVTFELE